MKPNTLIILLALLCILFTNNNAVAQLSVTGKVKDNKTSPLANCNALLLLPKDSSLLKGTICNTDGLFNLQNISPGSYLLALSHTGFENQYIPFTLNKENTVYDAGTITLLPTQQNLKEVTVVSKKPLFEQKIDRMVVNVKSSITSAGSTVLDVLQKSPGVIVNRQDGSISMSGKDGVQVMINGKMNYMPASALITMLDGMSANNVEKIELITTPPAKYDAGGNAGYINIVLVQNPNQGLNGSYAVSMGAWYGTFPSANFDFNYRKKKLNFYGSLAASRLAQLQTANLYRKIQNGNKITETYINTERDPSQLNFNVRFGIDYQLSSRTTVGVLVAGYNNKWHMTAFNSSSTFINSVKDTGIGISNEETNHWKHSMANINLQHTTAAGAEISVNADYLDYSNYNPTDYTNNYYNGSGHFLETSNLQSSKKTNIKIIPVQFDYRKKLSNKLEIEAGAKGVFSKFTNNVLVAELEQGTWKPDADFTGNYLLKENIGAAYASASITASE
ncbi:MAG: TonB-dependent receptor, partial [Bacteroidota bacterium]